MNIGHENTYRFGYRYKLLEWLQVVGMDTGCGNVYSLFKYVQVVEMGTGC